MRTDPSPTDASSPRTELPMIRLRARGRSTSSRCETSLRNAGIWILSGTL